MSNAPERFTAEQIAQENWAALDSPSMQNVECLNGHQFRAQAKFSGALVAIVARTPCPTCGGHELKSASSDWYSETLTLNDKGALK